MDLEQFSFYLEKFLPLGFLILVCGILVLVFVFFGRSMGLGRPKTKTKQPLKKDVNTFIRQIQKASDLLSKSDHNADEASSIIKNIESKLSQWPQESQARRSVNKHLIMVKQKLDAAHGRLDATSSLKQKEEIDDDIIEDKF